MMVRGNSLKNYSFAVVTVLSVAYIIYISFENNVDDKIGDSSGIKSGDSGGIKSGDSVGIKSGDSGGIKSGDSGGIKSGDSGGIKSGDSGGIKQLPVDSSSAVQVRRGSSKNGAFFYTQEMLAKDDEDWEKKECPMSELTNIEEFYRYIDTLVLHCDKPAMFGGKILTRIKPKVFAGEKWLCLSDKFNVRWNKCLIYSFGIDHDWSFDDDMDKKYGCQIYAFDPTINREDHNRSERIHFFNLGISDVSDRGPDVKKKVDRYSNIIKMLGHENTIIDFLKIDVEGYERQFFDDVLFKTPNLLKNVKMLSMEIHHQGRGVGVDQRRFWKYFQRLDCLGFKVWFSEMNPWRPLQYKVNGIKRSCCYELVWSRDKQW